MATSVKKRDVSLGLLKDLLMGLRQDTAALYGKRGRFYVAGEFDSDIAFEVTTYESIGVVLDGLKTPSKDVLRDPPERSN